MESCGGGKPGIERITVSCQLLRRVRPPAGVNSTPANATASSRSGALTNALNLQPHATFRLPDSPCRIGRGKRAAAAKFGLECSGLRLPTIRSRSAY